MLERLALQDRADVRMLALSGGETRRVDLASTLMGSPELVILDEPTTGLDPESRREVWRLVSDLRDGGATVLITTHYLEEAETLADRLEIMHAGRIVRSGTPTEIAVGHPSTISFARVDDVPDDLAGLVLVTHEHARTTLETDALQASLSDLLAWAALNEVELADLDARSPSLESVFLAIADGREAVDQEPLLEGTLR
jgi:ABC-2 type transport system ATP-binding protein